MLAGAHKRHNAPLSGAYELLVLVTYISLILVAVSSSLDHDQEQSTSTEKLVVNCCHSDVELLVTVLP